MPSNTRIVNMSIPLDIYDKVDKMARKRKTSKSSILKEALERYIIEEEKWNLIYKWGEEKSKSLGIRDEKDVAQLIKDFRQYHK
ncbi:ribbon-helix-helix protein, CopG family [Athalassotoga saccharophila]|uniref:ribbon-helix-helix protein, CopG family n=1 Tax=Athalassotoga saccharophila TaxID=1441386 RepID=UPI0013793C7B|nr:ribbon-helix-helix protein, CopG family [Athalassotoga saccharophila]